MTQNQHPKNSQRKTGHTKTMTATKPCCYKTETDVIYNTNSSTITEPPLQENLLLPRDKIRL